VADWLVAVLHMSHNYPMLWRARVRHGGPMEIVCRAALPGRLSMFCHPMATQHRVIVTVTYGNAQSAARNSIEVHSRQATGALAGSLHAQQELTQL